MDGSTSLKLEGHRGERIQPHLGRGGAETRVPRSLWEKVCVKRDGKGLRTRRAEQGQRVVFFMDVVRAARLRLARLTGSGGH